jgi:hypothetical protein
MARFISQDILIKMILTTKGLHDVYKNRVYVGDKCELKILIMNSCHVKMSFLLLCLRKYIVAL